MPRYTKSVFLAEKAVKDEHNGRPDRKNKASCPPASEIAAHRPDTLPESDLLPFVVPNDTQGKKGHKMPRINMAFYPENHAWLKTRSRQLGLTITDYVNALVTKSRVDDRDPF